MAHRKSQTPQSIQDIITALLSDDPRVATCRMVDVAKQEQYGEDAMPLVLVELRSAKQSQPGTANIVKWDLIVAYLTLRRNDWKNTVDAWSEGYNVLSDLVLRMQSDQQLKSWGWKFAGNESEYIWGNLKGRDDVISVSCDLSFTTPLNLSPCDLIPSSLPSPGSSYPGTPVPTPNWLTCDTIASCGVIAGMLTDIATLSGSTLQIIPGHNIVTGTTTSGVIISTSLSPSFNVINADTVVPKFVEVGGWLTSPSIDAEVILSGGTDLSLLLTGGSRSLTVRQDANTSISPLFDDAHGLVITTSSSPISVLIANDSTIDLPIGSQVMYEQGAVGQLRFSGASGVVLNSFGSAFNTIGQHAVAVITKKAANTWNIAGDLTTLLL